MASILKAAYRSIVPERARHWVDYARSPALRVLEEQVRFYNAERRRLFRLILRFCHVNRPTSSYYMEFGCHSETTMRMAWLYFRQFDLKYLAFGSFEGLPEIGAIDKQEIWRKGNLATAEEEFTSVVTRAGMPRDCLRTTKGFYDQSLTPDLAAQLLPRKAAVVYVDCDLTNPPFPRSSSRATLSRSERSLSSTIGTASGPIRTGASATPGPSFSPPTRMSASRRSSVSACRSPSLASAPDYFRPLSAQCRRAGPPSTESENLQHRSTER
jgi:hypothetical protein